MTAKMKNFLILFAFLTSTINFAGIPVKRTIAQNNLEQIDSSIDNIVFDVNRSATIVEQAPGYRSGKGFSIASFVFGILSYVFPPGVVLFAPLAIVFGAIGLSRELKGLAIAGLSLGLSAILFLGLVLVLFSGGLVIM
jgi:hypothetical protein